MKKVMKNTGLAAIALVASVASAQAVTISPAAGLDLSRNATQNAAVQVYSEQTGVQVGANEVIVDYLVGNNLTIGGTEQGVTDFTAGLSLTAGTYSSFLVHFDPNNAATINNFSVDFGSTIVGIILSNNGMTSLLNLSDSVFGTASKYDDHIGRRTEINDEFTLTNSTTLTFDLTTSAKHVDNIRVLTQVSAVPLPATLPLLLAGFAGMASLRRRS